MKTYQKSKHELHLIEVLTDMDAKGIRTLEDLQKEENAQVYTTLWFAMEKFVNYVGLKTKTHKTRTGKIHEGNAARLEKLLEMGADLEVIQDNVLFHVMKQMTKVLGRPVCKQVPYIVTTCTHQLVTEHRRITRCPVYLMSLDAPLGDGENFTGMDILSDPDTPESSVMAHVAVECARRQLLDELALLRSREQVFTYLCYYDDMDPREAAAWLKQLVDRAKDAGNDSDSDHAVETIALAIGGYYGIAEELRVLLKGKKPLSTRMLAVLNSREQRTITNKISNVKSHLPEDARLRLKERHEQLKVK